MSEVITDKPEIVDPDPVPPPSELAELGDAGKRALDAERRRARDAEKALKDAQARLDEFEQAKLTELEKAQRAAEKAAQERGELEQRLAAMERTAMVQRIGMEKGLPVALVGRLQGATEDEVSADADALLGLIGKKVMAPNPGQGPRESTPEADLEAEYRMYYPNS